MEAELGISKWAEALALHAEDVEIQHRRLRRLVGDLRALSAGGGRERNVRTLVEDLINYTEIHFSDEEEFMRRYGYPPDKLAAHEANHADVLGKLRMIRESELAGLVRFGPELPRWLKEWLDEHEARDDREYMDYFRSLGGI